MSLKIFVFTSILTVFLSACTDGSESNTEAGTPPADKVYSAAFKDSVKELAFATEMHCLEAGESPGQAFYDKLVEDKDSVQAQVEVIGSSDKKCQVEIKVTSKKGETETLTLPL